MNAYAWTAIVGGALLVGGVIGSTIPYLLLTRVRSLRRWCNRRRVEQINASLDAPTGRHSAGHAPSVPTPRSEGAQQRADSPPPGGRRPRATVR